MARLAALTDEELFQWIAASYKLLSVRRYSARTVAARRLARAYLECQARSRIELYRLAGNQWQQGEPHEV